jgi:hypothetical protein
MIWILAPTDSTTLYPDEHSNMPTVECDMATWHGNTHLQTTCNSLMNTEIKNAS